MRYVPDHKGVAALLRGDDMGDVVYAAGDLGAVYAASISPVESGDYISSFGVDTEVQGDRQTAILHNDSDHAFAVELRDHVLARTADWIERG